MKQVLNMMNDSLYKALCIKNIEEHIKNFKIISFEEGHNITYKPGQYLTLVSHSHNEEIRRSYSEDYFFASFG